MERINLRSVAVGVEPDAIAQRQARHKAVVKVASLGAPARRLNGDVDGKRRALENAIGIARTVAALIVLSRLQCDNTLRHATEMKLLFRVTKRTNLISDECRLSELNRNDVVVRHRQTSLPRVKVVETSCIRQRRSDKLCACCIYEQRTACEPKDSNKAINQNK